MKSKKIQMISLSAIIAALYVVLTMLASAMGLSSMPVQLRFSEALTVLPVFTSAAIPGLVIGCVIANFLSGALIWDVIFGSLATLIGAVLTYVLRKHKIIALLPPILSNTIIVPFVLVYAYGIEGTVWLFMLTVGLGELLSCGVLGYFLGEILEKRGIGAWLRR